MERSKCEVCGQAMVTKKATMADPYRYEMSGLDNVFLAGIEVGRCGKCDARVPVIPKIEQLHKAIAKYLVFKKDLLSGKEIRFFLDSAPSYFSGKQPTQFTVEVSYSDSSGRKFREKINHNLEIYRDLPYLTKTGSSNE